MSEQAYEWFDTLHPTAETVGTHGSRIWVDDEGQRYIGKQQDYFRSLLDYAIYEIQQQTIYFADRPEVTLAGFGPNPIAFHEWQTGEQVSTRFLFNPSEADLLDLQCEHAFDWMVGNHDSHVGNFFRRPSGHLVGVDKGQAFKHFHHDKLAPDYHPNAIYGERPPVYNDAHELFRAGKLVLPDPLNTLAVEQVIGQLQGIPDDKYAAILQPYAVEAARVGCLSFDNEPERFLMAAIERKHWLRRDMELVWQKSNAIATGIYGEWHRQL